jgi:hypothetical protein
MKNYELFVNWSYFLTFFIIIIFIIINLLSYHKNSRKLASLIKDNDKKNKN